MRGSLRPHSLIENDSAGKLEREHDDIDVGGYAALNSAEFSLRESVVVLVLNEGGGEVETHREAESNEVSEEKDAHQIGH